MREIKYKEYIQKNIYYVYHIYYIVLNGDIVKVIMTKYFM